MRFLQVRLQFSDHFVQRFQFPFIDIRKMRLYEVQRKEEGEVKFRIDTKPIRACRIETTPMFIWSCPTVIVFLYNITLLSFVWSLVVLLKDLGPISL